MVALLLMSSMAFASEAGVPVWTRWEQGLASSRDYGNPYADVTVSVRYEGPGGRSIAGLGFWDGSTSHGQLRGLLAQLRQRVHGARR